MKSGVKSKETRLFLVQISAREFELFEFELPGFLSLFITDLCGTT